MSKQQGSHHGGGEVGECGGQEMKAVGQSVQAQPLEGTGRLCWK